MPFQNFTCKHTHAPVQFSNVRTVSQKTARFGKFPLPVNYRQSTFDTMSTPRFAFGAR